MTWNPHHSARGNIYRQVVDRENEHRETAREHLEVIARRHPHSAHALNEAIALLANADPPPREWTSAIGLTSTIYIAGPKHKGIYHLKVLPGDGDEPFKLEVWNLDEHRSVTWSPDCGYSGTEAMQRIGLYRHTPGRIFGLIVDPIETEKA